MTFFLDADPLPKGEVYGFYDCPNCKKKCDAIINDKFCLKCFKKDEDIGTKTDSS